MFSDLFGRTFIFLGIYIACLVCAKKEAGRAVEENSLFLFVQITHPFWHLPGRRGFTKRNK